MTSINCLLGTYNFNQPVQFNRLFKWDPIQQLTNNNLAKDDGDIPSSSNQNPKRIQLTDEMLQKEIQEILPKVINTKQENIGFYGK
uniref:Uncharacterized protein n=1 Tax=Meloidogyne floridensis TaxID=298350 RepID=A0A915P0T4_9BILA